MPNRSAAAALAAAAARTSAPVSLAVSAVASGAVPIARVMLTASAARERAGELHEDLSVRWRTAT